MAETVKNRSGTENRQRQDQVCFRAGPDEHAAVRAAAKRAGMPVASFVRRAVLDAAARQATS
jgi:uncharacterized protein (DUF1778 family)